MESDRFETYRITASEVVKKLGLAKGELISFSTPSKQYFNDITDKILLIKVKKK